jgi:hypothetical protein
MKTRVMMCCLTIASCGAFAQHDHHASAQSTEQAKSTVQFKDPKLGRAYDQYIKLKDALVASDKEAAKVIALDLHKTLVETKSSAAAASVAELLKATDLEGQRLSFSNLSNEMAIVVKGGKLSAGSLYVEYCPMANNNTGAFWLSNEKEIKNPYFGDMMLKCGSVKETIQ